MSASIIVVDDEPDVAELFRHRFRREARQGTYVMHFAASGEAALELLSGGIDPGVIVILSDINMPGMDGLQLLGEIKERFPDLPVVMVTAYGTMSAAVAPASSAPPSSSPSRRFRPAEGPAAPAAACQLDLRCDFHIY